MSNPYQKYLTKEHKLQHAVITYLKFNYPGKLFTHVPNEGKRSRWEQFLIKYLGVSPGVPDLMIFDPNDKYNGLAIEFKIKSLPRLGFALYIPIALTTLLSFLINCL